MKYRGCITEKALVKRNTYVIIEADSEEDALKSLKNNDYEIEEQEDIEDLGVIEILNEEIIDIYD